MNIFKQITLIISIFCIAMPLKAMEQGDGNQGFFGRIWDAAQEHPIITGSVALAIGAGIWAYRNYSLNDQLYDAVCRNAVDEVRYLIKKGAAIETRFKYSRTVLHEAAYRGFVEITEALLLAGADVEAFCPTGTPLHFAAMSGCTQIVEVLLNAGAAINALNSFDLTPLHYAAEHGPIEVVTCLLKSGAFIDAKDNGGHTPLRLAIMHTGNGKQENRIAEVCKFLVQRGASVAEPLYYVASVGNAEVVRLLLTEISSSKRMNHDVEIHNALHVAIERGHVEVVKLFLEKCVCIKFIKFEIETLLHRAIKNNQTAVVKLLLHQDYNCPVHVIDPGTKERIYASLCAFNRLQPRLPANVRTKILSFLPEDIFTQEQARIWFLYGANLQDMVALCPLQCFVQIYLQAAETNKSVFLEKMVSAVVENRLQNIREWLAHEWMQNLDQTQINPEIMVMLDPNNVEQHRAAIEQNVREAFVGKQQDSNNVNNNNNV